MMKKICMAILAVLTLATAAMAKDFPDVSSKAWYAPAVAEMADYGVVGGYEDGTFRPNNMVTVGEILKMTCAYGGIEVTPTTYHWASGYGTHAVDYGWISPGIALDAPAPRLFVAQVVLGYMGVKGDYVFSDDETPYADTDSPYAINLYQMGIMQGSNGTFKPNDAITRAEVCQVFSNMTNYLDNEYGVTDFRYFLPQVKEPVYNGLTEAYFRDLMLYMMVRDIETYTVEVPLSFAETSSILQAQDAPPKMAFNQVKNIYAELGAFYENVKCQWNGDANSTTLALSLCDNDFEYGNLMARKWIFLRDTERFSNQLQEKGMVQSHDCQWQQAYDLAKFTAQYCAYDTTHQPISFTGYGFTRNRTAVCQGYMAFYSAILKMHGIYVEGVYGVTDENHVWAYACLDGRFTYIDPTWCDPTPDEPGGFDDSYFDVNLDGSTGSHTPSYPTLLMGLPQVAPSRG